VPNQHPTDEDLSAGTPISTPRTKTCPRGPRPTLPALSDYPRLQIPAPSFQRINSRPENLRHFGACTSSGITAENRPGSQNDVPANAYRFRSRFLAFLMWS